MSEMINFQIFILKTKRQNEMRTFVFKKIRSIDLIVKF